MNRPKRPFNPRPRPNSAMPQTRRDVHPLYVEIANLQMARARQVTIRDALLEQIARCDSEIERVDARTEALRVEIAAREEARDGEASGDGASALDARPPRPRGYAEPEAEEPEAERRKSLSVERAFDTLKY